MSISVNLMKTRYARRAPALSPQAGPQGPPGPRKLAPHQVVPPRQPAPLYPFGSVTCTWGARRETRLHPDSPPEERSGFGRKAVERQQDLPSCQTPTCPQNLASVCEPGDGLDVMPDQDNAPWQPWDGAPGSALKPWPFRTDAGLELRAS